ncbi:conserved hypothetical protein [Novosphingobium sp. 9U]|nr:conserved hypothetical protein [Novosphingobium sp. 9U]
MQTTRITAPAFPAVSADELETWLRIDCGSDPETLSLLVGSATEIVEGLTNRVLGSARYRIDFAGSALCYSLPISPVLSVESVEVDGEPLTGWRYASGIVHFEALPASAPVVTVMAGSTDVASIPGALRHAIAVLVSASYNNREEVSDQTIRTVERLCAPHRRIVW